MLLRGKSALRTINNGTKVLGAFAAREAAHLVRRQGGENVTIKNVRNAAPTRVHLKADSLGWDTCDTPPAATNITALRMLYGAAAATTTTTTTTTARKAAADAKLGFGRAQFVVWNEIRWILRIHLSSEGISDGDVPMLSLRGEVS